MLLSVHSDGEPKLHQLQNVPAENMICRRQEHEKQVQLLLQQLKAAEEEHRGMQARLEASIQAAAAKEAEAAAAAKAEQAAVQAAAQAKQQQQASSAAAAVAGAQPQLSSPGFQPLALPQQQPVQLPEQQVWQEFEGQRLLNTAAAAAAAQPSAAMQRFGWTDVGTGLSASRTCLSPIRDESPTYASRIRDMQDHINVLNRSLADTRRSSSPKKQHVHKSSKRVSSKDRHGVQEQSKRQRSMSPPGPARRQQGVKGGVTDLFDSDAESDEEAESSSRHTYASEASSDRCDVHADSPFVAYILLHYPR